GRGRGGGPGDGQARVALPGRAARRRGGLPRPRRRLPGLRRVRDDRGRGGQRLGGPRPHDPRVAAGVPSGRRLDGADLLRERGRRLVPRRAPRAPARIPLSSHVSTSTPAPHDLHPHLRPPPAPHDLQETDQMTGTTSSTDLFSRARQMIPSGVNSPVRAFGSVGGTPPFLTSAKGARLHDADGNEYVDLVGSWGPMVLGHADDRVVDAVREAAGRGLSFGAPQPGEVTLAEEVVRRITPVEQLRLVNSGTEATM